MPDDRDESSRKAGNDQGGSPPAGTTILGIGASAATPGPLEQVLAGLMLDPGMAAVVVLQAREALNEDAFRRALGDQAEILRPVADGEFVAPGHIYLPPADVIVTLEDGRFRTRQAAQDPGARGTIDSFFVSLAQDREGRAVGVVLGGTGADGTLGLVAIKEGGGLTVAEESEEVRVVDLAASSSPAAIADLVLPAEQIAPRIALYIRHLARRAETAALDAQAAEAADLLARIAAILRNKTGHDFHGYKQNTFLRRVQRRMQVLQADSIPAYVEMLQSRPDEPQLLFNDLLIGVTHFFRDRREFELIEKRIVPALFEGKGRSDQLRVWVIGCSTGEEAYSLAMLLREEAARRDVVPQIQIFASDLDGRALAIARAGRYPDTIARDVPPDRLARWFVKEGNTYCIAKELREICIFSQHSVVKDAPFSRLDLISCRNLLIYLNGELQNRLIPLFHFALRPGGYLFLGNSENISHHTKLFAPVDRAFRIFQRLETGTRLLPDFPFTPTDRRMVESVPDLPP